MRFLSLIANLFITLPLTLFALSFALSNRLPVGVALWPLETAATPAPRLGTLGVVLLGAGFLLGALFVGLFAQGWRYRAWQQNRKNARLQQDLTAAEEKLAALARAAAADKALAASSSQQPSGGTQAALRDAEGGPFRFS